MEFQLLKGILLKMAVSPLLLVRPTGTAICTQNGISLQVLQYRGFGMVMAVLRINSSNFDTFNCDANFIEEVNLSVLNYALSSIENDRTSIHVSAGHGEDRTFIAFHFEEMLDIPTLTTRVWNIMYNEPRIPGIAVNHLGRHESEYQYEVVLGIPSEQFRQILRHMYVYGIMIVDVFITEGEVLTFRSADQDRVLTTEDGCIVWGAEWYVRIQLRMTLYHLDSILEASENSALVWMFKSPDSPVLLNCPIGSLGNIMFYFNMP